MFQVVLSDIEWASKSKALPNKWVYNASDLVEATWQDLFKDSFRGNTFEFRKLLKDVFQVEAERQYGASIIQCRMDIKRNV